MTARRRFFSAAPPSWDDPIGLISRVMRHGGRHGRAAIYQAIGATAAFPFDWLLSGREARAVLESEPPRLPMILVCGAARSGTTVMAESLIRAGETGYTTNLMAMFPRSPITVSLLFRLRHRPADVGLGSHYGRTAGLTGVSDGLPIWDGWVGSDRANSIGTLLRSTHRHMQGFFGLLEQLTGRPIVAKNNSLNLIASDLATYLPFARFVCMQRDPVYLAQSLIIARRFIHGNEARAYGVTWPGEPMTDPVEDVIRQVRFHTELANRQLASLGPDRFRIVSYEALCAEPRRVVTELCGDLLGIRAATETLPETLPVSRRRRVDPDAFGRFVEALG